MINNVSGGEYHQSLSPPPRLSALPLFQRGDVRYHSLPTRSTTARWKPPQGSLASSSSSSTGAAAAGDESPEEGGFLEYNNNRKLINQSNGSSSSSSSAASSCSLGVSFTSSLNEPTTSGGLWPNSPAAKPQQQQPVATSAIRAVNLVRRTTISDFKRKLLQLNNPPQCEKNVRRMSAVELLKSTATAPVTKNNVAMENLIRRSARVSYIASRLSHQQQKNVIYGSPSPRTDVLSSTIVEGKSEEELNDELMQQTSSTHLHPLGVRRQLSFQSPPPPPPPLSSRSTPSSGSSTPIETSL